ncbi:HAD family hydrolase [Poseidonibacter ostreae]|uniref:HAD-IA family hydrolase n=1 Tax=Poseidonibacter ostreae TaxID=2654171 RepID=A0ABQ6VPY3_9BACT|nr:HAD family hydrolase [Poseidonibacter ostreae]KAB7892655.1 HAD-IA family hydrolase [Poseidonibacter ostreae]
MRYKGLLLDIDNTLYGYDSTHKIAKNSVLDYCNSKFNLTNTSIEEAYDIARKKVHIELSETASSHNRLLYIQKMLEHLNINPLEHTLDIYNIYWDTFLENMKPFDGVYELLEMYKGKICLVTDLTAHIQHRKVQKLELDRYCTKIVTSEESGREKPHPYMFMSALGKLDLKAKDVCMIGDSLKKDIVGASSLNIKSIWLNSDKKIENYDNTLVQEVKTFNEILELV